MSGKATMPTERIDLEQFRGQRWAFEEAFPSQLEAHCALHEYCRGNSRAAGQFLGFPPSSHAVKDRWDRLGLPCLGNQNRRALAPGAYTGPQLTSEEAWQQIRQDGRHPARRVRLRSEEVLEVAREAIRERTAALPAVSLKTPHRPPGGGDEEDMVALFSDLQVGHRTVSTNSEVLHQRVQCWAEKVLTIVRLHRKLYPIRRLWVFVLGDMVQNELVGRFIDLDSLEAVVGDQYLRASDFLAEGLYMLAPHFDEIKVKLVRGNHGQVQEYAANRSSWDDVVYERARLLLQNQANLHFEIAERFFLVAEVRGWKFLLVHGDQIPSTLSIPLYGITNRAMRWQGSIGNFDYLCLGHFHSPAMMTWNRTEVLMNGCFVSDDEYVTKRLGFASQPSQLVLGVHDKHGVTWRYRLDLREEQQ